MNCNRCGTPIIPGENSCRFCGAVENFTERKYIDVPEIIDFIEPEIIDFTTGEDDVVVSSDAKPVEPTPTVPTPVPAPAQPSVPVAPAAPVKPVMAAPTPSAPAPTVVKPAEPVPAPAQPSAPVVAPEPVKQEVTPVSQPAPVTPITAVPVGNTVDKKEETVEEAKAESTPNVPAEPKTEEVTEVSASTPVVVTSPAEEKKEEVKAEKPAKEKKEKKGSSLSLGTFVLVVLLIASIVLNCFLLMGNSEDNTPAVKDEPPVVSETTQTLYFNSYKLETPSNWIAVSTSNVPYLTIMDRSEEWAVTIDVSNETDSTLIEKSAEQIKEAFKNNKYLFTDSYPKNANNREYYVFKGKYQNYTVYVITTKLENNTTVVADLKFKGEVEEDVLEKVLTTMSTVSVKNLTEFYDENFDFGTITGLVKDNLVVENIDTTNNNNSTEGN